MTSDELSRKLNNEFGLGNWPETYEVDAETYANCCQAVFDKQQTEMKYSNFYMIPIFVGKINRGLMFKGVELILRKDNEKIPTNTTG